MSALRRNIVDGFRVDPHDALCTFTVLYQDMRTYPL